MFLVSKYFITGYALNIKRRLVRNCLQRECLWRFSNRSNESADLTSNMDAAVSTVCLLLHRLMRCSCFASPPGHSYAPLRYILGLIFAQSFLVAWKIYHTSSTYVSCVLIRNQKLSDEKQIILHFSFTFSDKRTHRAGHGDKHKVHPRN